MAMGKVGKQVGRREHEKHRRNMGASNQNIQGSLMMKSIRRQKGDEGINAEVILEEI